MDFDANLSFAGRALVVEASSPQGEALGASPWPAAGSLREPSLVLGERLFGLLFPGDVRTLFERCRGALSVEGGSLRLRIRVRPEAKPVLKLQALPWEMVRDPSSKEFLALRHDVQIVRYLSLPTPVSAPLRLGSEPLDVLLAVASPRDLAPIAFDAERQAIESALSGSALRVRTLLRATRDALAAELRERPVHILHLIGHGCGPGVRRPGAVFLETRDGGIDVVAARTLVDMTRQNDGLRLVFLNTCSSASLEGAPFEGLSSSVGPALALRGIPTVVAMKSPIRDRSAIAFAGTFYSHLRSGATVEAAAHAARLALAIRATPEADWPIPAVFTRTRDEPAFAVAPSEAPHPADTALRVRAGQIRGDRVELTGRLDEGESDASPGTRERVAMDVKVGVLDGGTVSITGTRRGKGRLP